MLVITPPFCDGSELQRSPRLARTPYHHRLGRRAIRLVPQQAAAVGRGKKAGESVDSPAEVVCGLV